MFKCFKQSCSFYLIGIICKKVVQCKFYTHLFFINLSIFFVLYLSNHAVLAADKPYEYVIAQASTKIDTEMSAEDDVNELGKANITTRVYKSNDPALELLDNPANINAATLSDLLSKEELLKGRKADSENSSNRNSAVFRKSLRSVLFPWFILFGLVLFLSLIFRFITQTK